MPMPTPTADADADMLAPTPQRLPVQPWLRRWVTRQADPVTNMDSLDGVLHHYTDAWRRREDPAVVLVHFNDLLADLAGQVARLAAATQMDVTRDRIHDVAAASTFAAMRPRAELLAPDPAQVMFDRSAFFRRGAPGAGSELLTDRELAAYRDRVRAQVPSDLAAWLLRV